MGRDIERLRVTIVWRILRNDVRGWDAITYLEGMCYRVLNLVFALIFDSSVSTVLRLPQLVKFSPYLEECLEVVSKHPNALTGDKIVCSLVRLMHITEDVGLVFHMDDPGSSIQLNDSRTQYHLKMFERQLADWKVSAKDLMDEGKRLSLGLRIEGILD